VRKAAWGLTRRNGGGTESSACPFLEVGISNRATRELRELASKCNGAVWPEAAAVRLKLEPTVSEEVAKERPV